MTKYAMLSQFSTFTNPNKQHRNTLVSLVSNTNSSLSKTEIRILPTKTHSTKHYFSLRILLHTFNDSAHIFLVFPAYSHHVGFRTSLLHL
jgi:hypothetical protein